MTTDRSDPRTTRAFIDLHCHTSASFDSLSDPAKVVRAASDRGLTHLAITDHDRIDGALRARDAAPDGLSVIVGQEVRTRAGDLIAAFIERPIDSRPVRRRRHLRGPGPGRSGRDAASVRPVARLTAARCRVAVADPARRLDRGPQRAAPRAAATSRLPRRRTSMASPVSPCRMRTPIIEVGVAYTVLDGDPSTPAGLLAALPTADLVTGRASYAVRLWTPLAKGVQRARGNGRSRPPVGA